MIQRTPEAELRHQRFLEECKSALEIFEYGRKYGAKEVVDFVNASTDGTTIFNFPAGHTKMIEWGIADPEDPFQ